MEGKSLKNTSDSREHAGAEDFGDGPGLGEAADGAMGFVALEDFGDLADASFVHCESSSGWSQQRAWRWASGEFWWDF